MKFKKARTANKFIKNMKTLPIIKTVRSIHKLQKLGVIIKFSPEEEIISPFDQFEEREMAEKICNRAHNGDMAAWFCAKVTVKFKGYEEDDYLGGCSYNSFKEFTNEDKGYYIDMINQCVIKINKDIEFTNSETKKWWNIRKARNILKQYGMFIVSTDKLQTI